MPEPVYVRIPPIASEPSHRRNAAPQRAAPNLPTVPRDGETQSDGLNS
jgi:hypothetical protein